MNPTPAATPAPILQAIDGLFRSESFSSSFGYLAGRFRDERGHEKIEQYEPAFRKLLPPGFVLTRATARPFGFEFRITLSGAEPSARYRFALRCSRLEWRRIA